MDITPLRASAVTKFVNETVKEGGFSNAIMAIAMAKTELHETKGLNTAKKAQINVSKLDAANQLTAQLKALEGLRVEKGITDKTKTMEGQATDCAQFVKNLKDAGISVSADEYTKWSAGKMTDADLKTIESRIKAMSDSASSESQMINLEMQKANNAMQQATNMFMSFLDSFKQTIEKIFR